MCALKFPNQCFSQKFFVIKFQRKMLSHNQKYRDAINALNQFQINKMLPGKEKRSGKGLVVMKQFLDRVHITNDDINALKIIHVTGTKGKGSTCAFAESILRHNGIKTGFFSSPHLVEVRERIRINGKPISHDLFSMYFWKVYDMLDSSQNDYLVKMPSYFYFLTTMAFYVFKHESVGAAIMEVGIGGAYDCTNVIEKPMVCGISSLGIDHVETLGNSLESIAWHKAGIFKKNVPAFTVEQPEEGLKVMHERAEELGTSLNQVPDLSKYWQKAQIDLSLGGGYQKLNASLAVQLAYCWLSNGCLATPLTLPQSFINGLSNCHWNGRAQTIKFKNITFYLDGAHTRKSIAYAAEWFNEEASKEAKKLDRSCSRVLCFNATKKRNAEYDLLRNFVDMNFSSAIFTPNIATLVSTGFNDQTHLGHLYKDEMSSVRNHDKDWQGLFRSGVESIPKSFIFSSISEAIFFLSNNHDFGLHQFALSKVNQSNDVNEDKSLLSSNHLQVLVTGSMHLVGGYLSILKPNLNN